MGRLCKALFYALAGLRDAWRHPAPRLELFAIIAARVAKDVGSAAVLVTTLMAAAIWIALAGASPLALWRRLSVR